MSLEGDGGVLNLGTKIIGHHPVNLDASGLLGGVTLGGTKYDDQIIGTAFADALNGGDRNDVLDGGGGNDRLNGGAGIDAMSGGAGNDTYYVNAATDQAIESPGEGIDTVFASTTYTL